MKANSTATLLGIILWCYLAALPSLFAQSNYRLAKLDEVKISVYDETDLSGDQRLDGNGNVSIPLIGEVRLSGLTLREAEKAIETKFVSEQILRAPQVTITITSHVEKTITVLGQVARPGPVDMPMQTNSMSITDVISRAGGFGKVAKKTEVRVTRNKGTSSEKTYEVNVYDLMEGDKKTTGKDFIVYPGDTIFVPERIF